MVSILFFSFLLSGCGGGSGGGTEEDAETKNTKPIASSQTVVVNENKAKAIILDGSDADDDPLTYTIVANPTHGTLSGTAPNLTYTPNTDYIGTDSFTFKVNDGKLDSNIATVTITVNEDGVVVVNTKPVANNQTVSVNENKAKAIILDGSDADDDPLTYTIVANPTHGTLSGTAPNLTYTPNTDYSGSDSFTFKVNDGKLDSNIATLSITVNEDGGVVVNTKPVANNQTVSTDENIPKAIILNGSDADGDSLAYSIVTNPTHGTLSGTAPNLIYTPNTNYSGNDTFRFKVNDGQLDSNIATVTITINAVNTKPVANAQSVSTDENTPKAIILSGNDADGDPLIYSIVTNPTHGTLSGTAPNLTYTPNTNYSGNDTFRFKVNDGTVDSNIATVSITVNAVAVNTKPVANNQTVSTNENTPKAIILSGSDADGDPLTYSIVTNPTHGTLSGTAPNLTYTPNTNYSGNDTFTFKVNDGTVDSNIATVTITVNAVNTKPVANNQTVSTNENTPKAIILSGSDADGDPLTYSIVTNPTHGTLSGTAPNLTYTPNTNYSGNDTFTFKVNDGTVDSNIATLSITVNATPDTTSPRVSSINPRNLAKNVPLDTNITIVFSENIQNPEMGDISFKDSDNNGVTLRRFDYNSSTFTLVLDPSANLKADTTYTVVLKSSIVDLAGNPLALSTYTFRTQSNPVSTSKLIKTGQTISYKDYDDGYYEMGISPNFTRGGGIVSDHNTGLHWQDDSKIKTEATEKTWEEAKTYCQNLVLGGYHNWRVPTIDELETIVHYGRYKNNPAGSIGAIHPAFENINSNDFGYWSSTTDKSDTSDAWGVDFNRGYDSWHYKTYRDSVRCVR